MGSKVASHFNLPENHFTLSHLQASGHKRYLFGADPAKPYRFEKGETRTLTIESRTAIQATLKEREFDPPGGWAEGTGRQRRQEEQLRREMTELWRKAFGDRNDVKIMKMVDGSGSLK